MTFSVLLRGQPKNKKMPSPCANTGRAIQKTYPHTTIGAFCAFIIADLPWKGKENMPKKKKEPEVKLPAIKQLPSGAWLTRILVDGRRVSITKDSYGECVSEYLAVKHGVVEAKKAPSKKTLTKAIDNYIEDRKNILSPATVRGYRTIQKHRFPGLMSQDVSTITPEQCQRAVNLEAKTVSAKTISNAWGFVASVIAESTGQVVTVRLPQVIPAERPWLTPEQVPAFVKAVKGDVAEIPALLALSSLRRSETVGLRWSDIDLEKGVIHVNGATVPGEDHKFVRKSETKNTTSRRTVPIIPPLLEALKAVEHHGEAVVTVFPDYIAKQINKVCDRAGLPQVGVHGLRHSFASLAYHLGWPEKVAMEIGGWADDRTMHKIYTHISRKSVEEASASFNAFFGGKIGNSSGNENQKES